MSRPRRVAELAGRTGIVNLTRGIVLATDVRWAANPWTRFLGLMGRADLPAGQALVFPGEKIIHTHFMRFAIDVVFYGPDGRVVALEHATAPWRLSKYHRTASGVIELPSGTLRASGTEPGDQLSLPKRG